MDRLTVANSDHCITFAKAFADQHIRPRAAQWEFARQPAEDAVRLAAERGLAGVLVKPEQGGLGLSATTTLKVFEALAAAHLPFAFALVVHVNLTSAIARLGTHEQQQRWLPKLLSGAAIGAFCLTEPTAGSDPAAISTHAELKSEQWCINGEKAWVSNGAYADLLSVYAQTDASQGWRGIATLLVDANDQQDAITRLPNYALLGGHALGTTGLQFNDVCVAADALLAPAGQGFKAAMAGIDLARILLSGMCCGILQDSLDFTLAYTEQRRAFGKPIAEFQGLQWSLADVATELAAARALALQAAAQLDAGTNVSLLAAQSKKFATKTARQGIAVCMQALGAVALQADNPLSRHLASAQMSEYLDGTTGIQNVVIARQLWPGK